MGVKRRREEMDTRKKEESRRRLSKAACIFGCVSTVYKAGCNDWAGHGVLAARGQDGEGNVSSPLYYFWLSYRESIPLHLAFNLSPLLTISPHAKDLFLVSCNSILLGLIRFGSVRLICV
jgi:hypothetical protein